MNYELVAIQENNVFAVRPIATDGTKNFTINWSWELDYRFHPEDRIEIRIAVILNVIEPEDQPDIAHFSASHFFFVPNSAVVEERLKELDSLNDTLTHGFMATLVGISVGTMRGLAFARTVGLLGQRIFMPVVNPSDLFLLTWENKLKPEPATR